MSVGRVRPNDLKIEPKTMRNWQPAKKRQPKALFGDLEILGITDLSSFDHRQTFETVENTSTTPSHLITKTKRGLTLRYGVLDECFETQKSKNEAKADHDTAMKKIKQRLDENKSVPSRKNFHPTPS